MLSQSEQRVYVLSSSGAAHRMAGKSCPAHCAVVRFRSPLELIAACISYPPLLIVVEINNAQHMDVTALQVLVEQPDAPRMLLLAQPGMVDEVMQELYRAGQDQVLLWPSTEEDFQLSINQAMVPMGSSLPDGLGAAQ